MSKWNEGYAAGHKAAWERRDATDHLIRYGAIRRAAEVARRYDRAELEMAKCNFWEAAGVYGRYADNIRRAIRVAIGSEKS